MASAAVSSRQSAPTRACSTAGYSSNRSTKNSEVYDRFYGHRSVYLKIYSETRDLFHSQYNLLPPLLSLQRSANCLKASSPPSLLALSTRLHRQPMVLLPLLRDHHQGWPSLLPMLFIEQDYPTLSLFKLCSSCAG